MFKVGDKVVANEQGLKAWGSNLKPNTVYTVVDFYLHKKEDISKYCLNIDYLQELVIYHPDLVGHRAEDYDFIPNIDERKPNYLYVTNLKVDLAKQLYEEDML